MSNFFWLFLSLIFILGGGCTRKPLISQIDPEAIPSPFEVTAEKLSEESQFKSSNYYLKKAAEIYERGDQHDRLIQCHIRIGNNYTQMGDHSQAMEHFNRALDLLLKYSGYEYAEIAGHFKKLAYVHLSKKEYDQALDLYQKALKLQLKVFNENHLQIAKTYNSIALIYWNKGDNKRAVEYYNKSLSIKLRSSIFFHVDFEKKYAYIDGGETNYSQFRQLRNDLQKSLKTYHETYGGFHPLIAEIYEKIGILFGFEGSFDRAMQCFKKSLNIRIESMGDESQAAASSYHNIGVCLRLQKDYQEAIRFIEKSLRIKVSCYGENHPNTADSYYQLGKVYFFMDQFERALIFFQKAIVAIVPQFSDSRIHVNPKLDRIFVKSELLKILADKADALYLRYLYDPGQIDDLKVSLETYRLVANLIDMIRREFKSEDYKLIFGEKSHEIYGRAIKVALSLHEITGEYFFKEEAFLFSERSKAALLFESVVESNARRFSGIPEELLEKERDLKKDLAFYGTDLEKESQNMDLLNTIRITELESNYFEKQNEYQQLINYFESHYSRYFFLKYQYSPASISELRNGLDAETALVEYFLDHDILVILILTKENFKIVSHHIDADFYRIITAYYQAIKKIEEKSFGYLSNRLFQVLVEPVYKWIMDKKHLVIVPHGELYYIPFESLILEEHPDTDFSNLDYLIRHHAITYHYSASLWLFRDTKSFINKEKSFIGFAPVFNEQIQEGYILSGDFFDKEKARQTSENRSVMVDRRRFPQLLASEQEVLSIVEMFKKHRKHAAGYFHKKASERNFKQEQLQEYNFIHIATHSVGDKMNPKLSGLLFTQDEGYADEDGILYSEETFNLELNAELIVLSSCESGIGKLVRGEGMIALNRGFFYSGARQIIFSLWKIEDKATCRLMIELYKNILMDIPISQALKIAKLSLIKNRFTAFPKYWSGFILVGR